MLSSPTALRFFRNFIAVWTWDGEGNSVEIETCCQAGTPQQDGITPFLLFNWRLFITTLVTFIC